MIIRILVTVLILGNSFTVLAGPPSAPPSGWTNSADGPYVGDPSGGTPVFSVDPTTGNVTIAGSVTSTSAEIPIPATGTLTEVMHKHQVLDDSLLSGATDVQLLDLEYRTKFWIEIEVGDYAISLVPPSGEKLRLPDGTLLDADDEIDLTDAEGDMFVVVRTYSDAESEWVWAVFEILGAASDGGAS